MHSMDTDKESITRNECCAFYSYMFYIFEQLKMLISKYVKT